MTKKKVLQRQEVTGAGDELHTYHRSLIGLSHKLTQVSHRHPIYTEPLFSMTKIQTASTVKKCDLTELNIVRYKGKKTKTLADACLPPVKKKCLSSSHETGLAIAVHHTNNVTRVSRATKCYLQPSEQFLVLF